MQRDFKFADYAPLVFASLREKFGIDHADYLQSLTQELSCIRTPGAYETQFVASFNSSSRRTMLAILSYSEEIVIDVLIIGKKKTKNIHKFILVSPQIRR